MVPMIFKMAETFEQPDCIQFSKAIIEILYQTFGETFGLPRQIYTESDIFFMFKNFILLNRKRVAEKFVHRLLILDLKSASTVYFPKGPIFNEMVANTGMMVSANISITPISEENVTFSIF